MYSRWTPPKCIGKITIKNRTAAVFRSGDFVTNTFDDGLTWIVWNWKTGIVEAVFYGMPNQHGWSPSEAHAKSYCLRSDSSWSPYDLDNVP